MVMVRLIARHRACAVGPQNRLHLRGNSGVEAHRVTLVSDSATFTYVPPPFGCLGLDHRLPRHESEILRGSCCAWCVLALVVAGTASRNDWPSW